MSSPVREELQPSPNSSSKQTRSLDVHTEDNDSVIRDMKQSTFSIRNSPKDDLIEHDFSSLGITDMLALDPRPTFVVKLDSIDDDVFEIVFANIALRSNSKLLGVVQRTAGPRSTQKADGMLMWEFRHWLEEVAANHIHKSISMVFSEFIWSAFVIQKNWLVVGGNCYPSDELINKQHQAPSQSPADSVEHSPNPMNEPRVQNVRTASFKSSISDSGAPSFITPGTPDWTISNPVGNLSAHVIFARSVDWASTPLGDMNSWSPEFRQVANLLMANPHPAALFWGDELTVIYNKSYADTVAGAKHPKLMGLGFTNAGGFQELWDFVSSIFDECRQTGKSVGVTEQMLPIERFGFLEETFFTWSLTPLYGGTPNILGLYNAPFETTKQTRVARATRTLLKLGQETALAQQVPEFWKRILVALEDNVFDFPFALVYSVLEDIEIDDEGSASSASSQEMKSCVLEGVLGVPEGHPAAPPRLDLHRARGGFIPSFRDAMRTREPKLLKIHDGSLSEALLDGISWRGYGDPCNEAVVCPIRPTNGENVMGFLVVGVNPRRRFDEDYQAFIQLLDRQLATSLASVSLYETEIKRGLNAAEAAAIERARLSKELDFQRSRMQRMTEISAVGMFSIDRDGVILEANDRWYEITGHSRDENLPMSWMDTIAERSLPIMKDGWKRLTVDCMPWAAELNMKKGWYDSTKGEKVDNWILASAQPEFSMEGELRSIMGSITDISHQKRSEKDARMRARLSEQLLIREQEAKDLQERQLEEANENRRRQNNFIDITSHEMRNPLSAILQSADSISTSLKDMLNENSGLNPLLRNIIEGTIESSETIQLCAQHQKSIVDDILTISKLDSNLLLITPMPIQPVDIVQQALRMFTAECQMCGIKTELLVNESWRELGIDTVMLDSSRLRQVLVNLMSNAIKFTKTEDRPRRISISLDAFFDEPPSELQDFDYFPTNKSSAGENVTSTEDWGSGSVVFLRFEVRDSGCGLTGEEKKTLFTRYTQASPKTHVKYGGSGLGLFISRQLVELQGGEIGVASESGVGSTFAFYIKARKAEVRTLTNEPKSKHSLTGSPVEKDSSQNTFPSTPLSIQNTKNIDPKNWHVLLVEDNLINQKVLAKGIRKLGCIVHVANHGGEALSLLQETKYYKGREHDGKELTVILMDLEMPVMDGLTCVRKIREWEMEGLLNNHLPIVAVTANARAEQITAAKGSGMDDVMPKPFQIRDLVLKIEALLLRD